MTPAARGTQRALPWMVQAPENPEVLRARALYRISSENALRGHGSSIEQKSVVRRAQPARERFTWIQGEAFTLGVGTLVYFNRSQKAL